MLSVLSLVTRYPGKLHTANPSDVHFCSYTTNLGSVRHNGVRAYTKDHSRYQQLLGHESRSGGLR